LEDSEDEKDYQGENQSELQNYNNNEGQNYYGHLEDTDEHYEH